MKLIEELEQADAVLIGAPMYNFSIPSTLKAWLDNVILLGRTAGEAPSAQGTPVTVIASRGGSYAPGTPREGYEFVQNYLESVLKGTLGLDVDFIVPELTMAPRNPAMSELVPLTRPPASVPSRLRPPGPRNSRRAWPRDVPGRGRGAS